jgi:RNA polymerase sigma factor (sigma-70 family)
MFIREKYSTDEILDGIYSRDNKIISYVYKNFYPLVKNSIIKYRGSEKDAEDIFQNAVIVIYKGLRNNSLTLSVQFKTYLLSLCYKMWLRHYKRENIISFENLAEIIKTEDFIDDNEFIEESTEQVESANLFQKHFSKLDKQCQILLRMYYYKVPMEEIIKYFGLKNSNQVKKKKYRCKKELLDNIKNDPSFKGF